jgi:hypothetical protein
MFADSISELSKNFTRQFQPRIPVAAFYVLMLGNIVSLLILVTKPRVSIWYHVLSAVRNICFGDHTRNVHPRLIK